MDFNVVNDMKVFIPYLEEMNINIIATVPWGYIKETFPRFAKINEAVLEKMNGKKYSDDELVPLTNFMVDNALMFEKAKTYDELVLCFKLFCDKIFDIVSEVYVKTGMIQKEDKYHLVTEASNLFYADVNTIMEIVCKEFAEE